jgi:tetratricopeptide (TPR) repeat protein
MMKKITILILFSVISILSVAQTQAEAEKFLYNERLKSAENSFHILLERQPDNAKAWLGLVQTYLLQQNPAAARDTLVYAPAAIYGNPYYHIANGAILLSENNSDKARIEFNKALDTRKKRKNAATLYAIAEVNLNSKNGDLDYALNLLNKAIKRKKSNERLHVLKGDIYRKLKDGNEAYIAYNDALKINQHYAPAFHRLGELFLSQNNPSVYLQYFRKSVEADPNYSPSLHKLYVYEFYVNPDKAMEYYKRYVENADLTIDNEYEMADLLYLTHQYDNAIQKSKQILSTQQPAKPRLFKLIGYSYAEKGDTSKAIDYMNKYFESENDSNFIVKDFESMGDFYLSTEINDSLATLYYEKALDLDRDTASMIKYIQKLADIARGNKDYATEAKWRQKYYSFSNRPSNVDLFNWGLANYRHENYLMADSIFTLYTEKYPDQSYGHYWLAKTKALEDSMMTEGLAVPVYERLIQTLERDSTDKNFDNWMVEAYGYLAAYSANTLKNYPRAIDLFRQLLKVDPDNQSAQKYIAILEANMAEK